MRFVERAEFRPHRCALLPQIGADHPRGFYDTGNELPGWDDRVYVSVEGLELYAQKHGWVPPEELEEANERLAEATARADRLEDELNAAEAVLDGIDLLESKGYTARKKPGRPRKQTEERVA